MKLEFKLINKYFNQHHVLKDVSFTVEGGQIFGYLGRNGAGKTTSIRILMDVFKANSGEVLIDGKPFSTEDYKIGYLPEERGMYSKTKVANQLIYFAMLRGATHQEAKDTVNYWAKRFQIDQYLNRKLETLSKGNQQKVQITQAFLNEPDILILDEPFSGLDPVNSKIFQDALLEHISKDRIIIFSSHQMGYIESFCDSIAIIEKGRIVLEGSLEAIKKERGKNHIRVSVNDMKPNVLKEEIVSQFGLNIKTYKKHLIIEVNEIYTKEEVLKYLIDNNYDIHSFSDYEPSLQDIFIQEVGEHDETI